MPPPSPTSTTYLTWTGPVAGRLCEPTSGTGPAVLVLHEWWTRGRELGRAVERLAAAGFVALAPDLHGHHVARHARGDAGVEGAAVPLSAVVGDLAAALTHLQTQPAARGHRVAVIGFCAGGDAALELAAKEADRIGAVVLFDSTGDPATDLTDVRAPVLGHVGAEDPWCPPEEVARLREARTGGGTPVDLRSYEGRTHGFADPRTPFDDHVAAVDAVDAAWAATVAFLHEHLG